MGKEHIDEILNNLLEISEENGKKIAKFKDQNKKNAKSNRKRKPKSNSSDINGEI
jgi:hypothetical protein